MLDGIKKLFGMGPKVDLGELIKNGAIILDVRSKGEYAGGHVKGSINIPLDQLGSNLAKLKKDKVIITCCASGMRSGAAKGQLKSKGYEVHNGGSWMSVNRYVK
ncbi:MAG: rhodanese-like domain-containing protein [Bacteroidia bacterium]|nr:rhodanese-like domain-containing protein [Bacteroidia bacterium]